MDVRNDTAAGNRRFDQTVELLVSANGQLQMPGRDSLHLQVLGRVAGQFEDLWLGVEKKCMELISSVHKNMFIKSRVTNISNNIE